MGTIKRFGWVLRLALLAALLGGVLAGEFATPAQGALDPPHALLAKVNEVRARAGLGPVRLDQRLTRAAQVQSGKLASHGSLRHDIGGPLGQRVTRAGFRYWMIAENLAAGIADPSAVVTGWLRSAGHRRNLLRADARVAGIGYVARGKRYRHYWTLILAAPAE